VELEQRASERTERRHTGAALLGELLDGELPLAAVRTDLMRRGLPEPLVLACFHPAPAEPARRLHHLIQLHERYPLLLRRERHLYALLPDDPALVELLRNELGDRTAAGLSNPLTATLNVPEAARQARLALRHADPAGTPVARHAALSGLLPRSVTEARELVRRYVGPLAEHDRANGTELVHTLRTFLRRDGAWQASATELGIHRQTLVYRLRTVRELTGLHPTSTVGTATFWLALEAAEHTRSLDTIDVNNEIS
jgi:PucR-like helix-turn-helix protein/diguanylate cyclase with GGDEF domain